MVKRKSGRPTPEGGARKEIVKVSLNDGELKAIMKATHAPAQFLREEGLRAAKLQTHKPKPAKR